MAHFGQDRSAYIRELQECILGCKASWNHRLKDQEDTRYILQVWKGSCVTYPMGLWHLAGETRIHC